VENQGGIMKVVQSLVPGGHLFRVYPVIGAAAGLIGALAVHLKRMGIPFFIGGAAGSESDLALTFGPLTRDHEVELMQRWGAYLVE
jgi:hypothetical protein